MSPLFVFAILATSLTTGSKNVLVWPKMKFFYFEEDGA